MIYNYPHIFSQKCVGTGLISWYVICNFIEIATESSPAYVPPQSTKELMEFCEGYLRTLDPFLERHPRNLAGENDPTRNLEEMIDDKYSQLSEPVTNYKKILLFIVSSGSPMLKRRFFQKTR